MSKSYLISIITACFNAEKSIEQTILSVINQTYANIEYIVVDGASNDGTMEIVRKYEDKIDVIISEPDRGVYDAFNKGAKVAKGDYIFYLNADDYFYASDVIQNISHLIHLNNEPVLLYGGVLSVDEAKGYEWIVNKEIAYEEIMKGMMIPHQAAFLKTAVLLEMALFDTRYKIVSDYDLICKVYKKYNHLVCYCPILVSVFRSDGISSQFSNIEKIGKEKQVIINNHFSNNYEPKKISNEDYYKRWIEIKLYQDRGIADLLLEKGLRNVAIWGTGELSLLISREFTNKGINIAFYLDNDINKHQLKINNKDIIAPIELKNDSLNIDCIVMSFEGTHEESVLSQIDEYNLSKDIYIYSWRDLIKEL